MKTLVAALAMPLPAALLLAAVGVLLWLLGRRGLARYVLVMALFLPLLAAWAPVADRLLAPLEHRYAPVAVADFAGDEVAAIVVLGGGWDPESSWPATTRLGESSGQRLTEGLRLFAAFPEAQLVVSGGSRHADQGSARGYELALQELGVLVSWLWVLGTPVDTAQEAYAVRAHLPELLDGQRFFLVTSASHMPRAVRHFQAVGLEPVPAPAHFLTGRTYANPLHYWVPSAQHLRKTERAIYEYLGLLAWRLDHLEMGTDLFSGRVSGVEK